MKRGLGLGMAPGEAAAFSPVAVPGLSQWWDAQAADTIILGGGGVLGWNNRVAGGFNLTQPAAAAQPAYSANGWSASLPGITTDGVDDTMISSGTAVNPANAAIFAVLRGTWPAGFTELLCHGNPASGYAWRLRINDNIGKQGQIFGNTGVISTVGAVPTTSVQLFAQVAFGAAASLISVDGGLSPTSGDTGGVRASTSLFRLHALSSPPAVITFAEILVYNAILTTLQRQVVEGYLAWRWGIQANLPAGHPYKAAPP